MLADCGDGRQQRPLRSHHVVLEGEMGTKGFLGTLSWVPHSGKRL